MRILITGGAGFIGSHLARRLVQQGYSVSVLDNFLPQVHGSAPNLDLPGCTVIHADVRDGDAMAQAMNGVNVVYHLAAETGVGQSQYEIQRYVATNTLGTAVVLETAVAARVSQVVIASSRAVYGEGQYYCQRCDRTFAAQGREAARMNTGQWDINCPRCGDLARREAMREDAPTAPSSIYGVTKLQQEELALSVSKAHDLPVTILRFFNVFGPGQSLNNPYVGVLGTFFRRALAGDTVEVYEDGEMLRDFIFIDDVLDALQRTKAAEKAFGQILNVGTGIGVSLREVAVEIFRTLDLEPRLIVSGRYRLGDVRHAVGDSSRAASRLDFRAQVAFSEGVKQYIEWARKQDWQTLDAHADQQLLARNLLRQATVST